MLVESGKFPWNNGKFPQMTEPSRGYHGVRFDETFGDFGFTMKARMETMRTLGPTWRLCPRSCCCRASRRCICACRGIANPRSRWRRLAAHPAVEWVNYPLLEGNRYEPSRAATCRAGAGGILAFGIKGGFEAGVKFIEALTFVSHLANIGDAKSLVIHPASTTHRQLDEAEQRAAGVLPEMIRLSVGLEAVDDIIWDIDQSLAKAIR